MMIHIANPENIPADDNCNGHAIRMVAVCLFGCRVGDFELFNPSRKNPI